MNIRESFDKKTAEIFTNTKYVVLRPTCENGDGDTVITTVEMAEEYQIMAGLNDGPARTIIHKYTLEDAVEVLYAMRHERPEIKLWYNGSEALIELCGDPWRGLAKVLGELCDEWQTVYKVCTGQVLLNDEEAADLMECDDIHATAIAGYVLQAALSDR